MARGKPASESDWELESPLDEPATLEELIKAQPFREASDKLGHSITAATRIPSWLYRRVIKIKEVEGAPYEVVSDVLRDAVYLGLRILHLRYTMGTDWDVETKLAAIRDLSSAGKRIKEHFEELESSLEDLFGSGDEVQAAHRLADYVYAAGSLENDWHRNKIFTYIRASRVCREVAQYCDVYTREIITKKEEK